MDGPASPAAGAASTHLERVTTEYDAAEDRIRLSATTSAGETVTLWLTQRMMSQIIAHLITWLEDSEPQPQAKKAQPAQVQPAVQSFAQQTATATQRSTPPVQAAPQSRAWLVKEMNIRRRKDVVGLLFGRPGGGVEQFILDRTYLRQWLNILYRKWQTAAWPMQIWPDWIRQAAAKSDQEGAVH